MSTAWTIDDPPYLHVRTEGADLIADGSPHVRLGHEVDRGADLLPGGNWARWDFDGDAVTARNDVYAAYPVYYAASDGSLVISPSIDAILATGVDLDLDEEAVAAFLTIGYYSLDTTAFRSIRALPPHATFRWSRDGLSLQTTRLKRPAPDLSRQEAVTGTAEMTRQAVRRSIPDDPEYVLPISGGRDSRHLMLELIEAGHPPTAGVTSHHHEHVWGGDVPYAADLCAAYGIGHRVVTPVPVVAAELRKNRITSYCADEHAWYTAVTDAIDGTTSHTYDGLNGSTALDRGYHTKRIKRLEREGRWDDLASELGRKVKGKPRYAPLVAESMQEALGADAASRRLRAEIAEYEGDPEPYLSMRFWSRTFRELNLTSTAMLPGVATTYTPFLERDMADFLWRIPSDHLDESFHDDVIKVYFADSMRIPFRPRTRPDPSRSFLRELNRDLYVLLRDHSDGSLVDRRPLMRRTAIGSVTGSDWFALARRSALLVYLVQLESIRAGRGPIATT